MKSRLEKKISLQSSNNAKTGETPHQDEDDEQHGTVEDGVPEFDSSSDEETCAGEAFVEEESDLGNQQFTWDVDFLMGTTSRFGRSVRVNSLKYNLDQERQYVWLLTVAFTCALELMMMMTTTMVMMINLSTYENNLIQAWEWDLMRKIEFPSPPLGATCRRVTWVNVSVYLLSIKIK